MPRKHIAKYINPWMFKREAGQKLVARLRAAYGDLCWRCGHPMSFQRLAVRRRATIEHLLARSAGGTRAWANVRLCHVGCNRHLGTHSPDRKRRMRTALALEAVPDFAEQPAA